MRPLDFLSMAAVAGLLSWCAFDLFSRASDPYDITKPRQRIAPVGGITGHGEPWDVPMGSNQTSPKARGVAVNSHGIRDFSAPASPTSFPASFAGSIATRNQDQEVTPAPGRTKPSSPVKPLVQTARGTTLSRAPKIGEWVKVEISTYSARYHGKRTASGERYDHHEGHTAATTVRGRKWALPKGSVWEVEYPAEKDIVLKPGMTVARDFETGKTTRVVTVRINDTGSWRPKRAPYWLDLSGAAWRDLTGIASSRKVARMRRVR